MEEPPCPYFGTCGGCTSQHIEYEEQVKKKTEFVQKLFPKVPIRTTFDQPYHYRNRMDFTFTKKGIGLREKGSWEKLLPIEQCPISNEQLNTRLAEVQQWTKNNPVNPFDVVTQTGTLKYVVIRTPRNTNSITFILNKESPNMEEQIMLIKKFAETTTAKNILIGTIGAKTDMSISEELTVIKGDEMLSETLCNKTITYHSQAFFQNNTKMAEKMIEHVKELAIGNSQLDVRKTLVDLYGGAGTFGICLADRFDKTIIIDNSKQNITCAQQNIVANKLTNTFAICADAKALADHTEEITLIVDPPRAGLHPKVIKTINQLKPKTIIYISCNPKQMAQDIARLTEYKIDSLAVFDLFPQTEHVEAVAKLTSD
ncbi:23S rRNA (uracil(1939)-C(5))-methyltransferase RlmD [Candidatus Woesearchaeota archaeon]|nr:23S rRNA (uracil(1939)-C(5))-methyltransferase RlmD [Candidatus Woesearchaeota archaeon]